MWRKMDDAWHYAGLGESHKSIDETYNGIIYDYREADYHKSNAYTYSIIS